MFIYTDEAEKYKLNDVCVHENTTYKSGNEWKLDSCRKCKCVSGHIECTEMVCPQVCMDAIHEPGKCCPVCPGILKSISKMFLKKILFNNRCRIRVKKFSVQLFFNCSMECL